MKTKTLFLLFLIAGIGLPRLSAQVLQKGAVVVTNTYTVTLHPDVTMNQFMDFYTNKYIPEYEKCYPGIKAVVLKGDRGENKNQLGLLMIFESVAVRNKYYPVENDTATSALVRAADLRLKPLSDELNKMVIDGKRVYTDWIVR